MKTGTLKHGCSSQVGFTSKTLLCLLGILLLALVLRLSGIWRAAPVNYHPDDWVIARPVLKIANDGPAIAEKTHYKWSACSVIYSLGLTLYALKPLFGPYTYEQLLIIQRVLSAIASTAAVYVVFLLMRRIFSVRAGLLAALLSAVTFLPVEQGHFGTVTATVSLIIMLVLLLSCDLFEVRSGPGSFKAGTCCVLGLLCGFGLAAKWTIMLAAIPISGAFVISLFGAVKVGRAKEFAAVNSRRIILIVLMAVIGFIASMPDVLIWPEKVIEGLTFEIEHNRTGHFGEILIEQRSAASRLMRTIDMMSRSGGVYVFIFGLAAILYCLMRADRGRGLLLWVIFWWLIVVFRNVVGMHRHHLVPFTVMLLLVATAMDSLMGHAKKAVGLCAGWVYVFIVSSAVLYTCICISPFWKTDGREECARYIMANVPPGHRVANAPYTPIWVVPGGMVTPYPELMDMYRRKGEPGKATYIVGSVRSLNIFKKHPPTRPINAEEWFPNQPPPRDVLLLYDAMNTGKWKNLTMVKEFRGKPSFLGMDLRLFFEAPEKDTTFANQAVRLFKYTKQKTK